MFTCVLFCLLVSVMLILLFDLVKTVLFTWYVCGCGLLVAVVLCFLLSLSCRICLAICVARFDQVFGFGCWYYLGLFDGTAFVVWYCGLCLFGLLRG